MKSRFLKLYRAYSTRSIRQMLANLSGKRKRKRKSLSCVHETYISARRNIYFLPPLQPKQNRIHHPNYPARRAHITSIYLKESLENVRIGKRQ